ncbi:MAG: hypothetical protein ACLGG6_07815 [Gammaproteobacteria bacterium]
MNTQMLFHAAAVVLTLSPLAAASQPQALRPAACVPAVPPAYLAYHALAAPQAGLTPRRDAAGCAPRKSART